MRRSVYRKAWYGRQWLLRHTHCGTCRHGIRFCRYAVKRRDMKKRHDSHGKRCHFSLWNATFFRCFCLLDALRSTIISVDNYSDVFYEKTTYRASFYRLSGEFFLAIEQVLRAGTPLLQDALHAKNRTIIRKYTERLFMKNNQPESSIQPTST